MIPIPALGVFIVAHNIPMALIFWPAFRRIARIVLRNEAGGRAAFMLRNLGSYLPTAAEKIRKVHASERALGGPRRSPRQIGYPDAAPHIQEVEQSAFHA